MSTLAGLADIMSVKQLRSIFECSARINVWHGAVSSGKTIASLLAFLFAVVQAPANGLIFIVGRTLQTVERNIVEVLQQPAGPFGPFARFVHHTRGSNVATIFGRTVWLVGANDISAEGRVRGSTAALIYVDEATLVPEGFFTMCLSRLRVPGAKMLATTNPDAPNHWLRQKFLLREGHKGMSLRQWRFTLDDNPKLTVSYKESLKAEYTGLFYKRFIQGFWCVAEGAVYDSWDPARHVVDQVPHIEQWVALGIDYGTVNPFAALLLGLGVDGRLYLTDEYFYDSRARFKQLTDHEYSVEVRAFLDNVQVPHSGNPPLRGVMPQWFVLDPSAASFRLQLFKDGIASRLADNAVMPGIRQVSSLISTGRLKVHRRVTNFQNEIGGYSWDPAAAARGEDAPVKQDDHTLDAVRYAVYTTEAVWRHRLCDPNTDLLPDLVA